MQAFDYCKVQKYRRKRSIKRWPVILSVILILLAAILLHLNFNVNPLIRNACKNETSGKVLTCFNSAAKDELTNGFNYNTFVEVIKDGEGNVTLIQANSLLINVFSRGLALSAQDKINTLDGSVQVPLGVFSGFTVFSGMGKNVDVKIKPIGTVKTNYESKFESAGLNQTLHRIYLITEIEMMLVLPGKDHSFIVSEQIILCESIIVGKVPSIYFQMQ